MYVVVRERERDEERKREKENDSKEDTVSFMELDEECEMIIFESILTSFEVSFIF
jgi:hypothetical protein